MTQEVLDDLLSVSFVSGSTLSYTGETLSVSFVSGSTLSYTGETYLLKSVVVYILLLQFEPEEVALKFINKLVSSNIIIIVFFATVTIAQHRDIELRFSFRGLL